MKPVFYRVSVLRAGAQVSTKTSSSRERADAEFISALERARRMAALRRVPHRVELWGGDALIKHVDVPAGATAVQPRA